MAPSTLSLFLTALMFAGAMGATKGLGDTCTTGTDTCTSTPESVCDNVVKKCLIKQGQSCSGGFSGMCVSGAECTGDTCTCKTTVYTAAATGLCTSSDGKWGLACPGGAGDCTGTDTQCVGAVCVCNDDKAVALATGDCTVTIANEKVGKKCADGDKDTTCGAASTNLECPSGGGVCDCKTDYFGPLAGDCSPMPGKIGGGCSADGDCGTTNDKCSANVCECDTNYSSKDLNTCKIPLGGTCTADADCFDSATIDCDDLTKKCSLRTGQGCNSPTTNNDKCVSGASCDTTGGSATNNCKCITTPIAYTEDSTNKICKAVDGKVTGDCKTGSTCDDANAECETTSDRCKCKTGFTLKVADATCEKSGAISVIASALTVMLVAASGRLFSLH